MKLIFIFGQPAVGKLTIAKELHQMLDKDGQVKLFHNHLVVDLCKSIVPLFSPEFIHLRDVIWRESFKIMAKGNDTIIFTFSPENSVPQEFINDLFELYKPISISLVASQAAIESRIPSSSRSNKLQSVDIYKDLVEKGVFDTPVIPRIDLEVSTDDKTPKETATVILQYLARS